MERTRKGGVCIIMRDWFVFDGVDCRDFGIYAYRRDLESATPRVYDQLAIPGLSGAVLIDGKRYNNGTVSYGCIIPERGPEHLRDFRDFLLSRTGYRRLEDTFHKDEFFQAVMVETFGATVDSTGTAAKFNLTFSRKPQRFLKAGEIEQTLTANGTIFNPTFQTSRPLIRVYGLGEVGIGGITVEIEGTGSYVDIDCEIMECYTGSTSRNADVSFSGLDYPVLHAGANGITIDGPSSVVITPRWFRL